MIKDIFPILLVILTIGAGIMSISDNNYKKAFYWFAVALVNVAATVL